MVSVLDRTQFPFTDLHYFDSATFTLVPRVVTEEVNHVTTTHSGSPRQTAHRIGLKGIEMMKKVRKTFSSFFQTKSSKIIFTPDATDAFITIAFGLKRESGKVLVSEMLDHTALLPWYQAKQYNSLEFDVLQHDNNGFINLDDFHESLSQNHSTVIIPYFVPVLGTQNQIREIIEIAQSQGTRVVIDGRLAAGHHPINISSLGCDVFICDSNIGLMGPPGYSVLIMKDDFLNSLQSFRAGAGSVESVTSENFVPLPPPEGFEPGVGNIGALAGGLKALELLSNVGLERIKKYENHLMQRLLSGLETLDKVTIYGPKDTNKKGPILSFNIQGLNPHDVAVILDESGKFILRSGTMCSHLLFQKLQMRGVVQLSTHAYNTEKEVDMLISNISKIMHDLS
ncbi:MAG: aminotransferase class V-fold PLP-dependent enzyme [Candidatus Ranarchaeia archaeon]|jgi:cysteine desulfurase/selenocysteine lyase